MNGTAAPKEVPPSVIEESAAAAVGPVLKIGAAISGIVAVSYLIGLAYVKAYFSTIGAPWVVELLSYGQIARAGSVVATGAVIIAFTSLIDLWRTGADPKSIEKWARYTAIAAIVPGAISFMPVSIVPSAVANTCTLAMGLLLTMSAGHLLAELIGRFRQSDYRWTHHHLLIVFIIQVVLLTSAPSLYGSATAKIDADSAELPTVEGTAIEGGPWRLIRALDVGILIMAPAPEGAKHKHIFRLIPNDSAVTISSTSRRGA